MLQNLTINYVITRYASIGYFPLVLVQARDVAKDVTPIAADMWRLLAHEPAIYDPKTDRVMRLLNASTGWTECDNVIFIQTADYWMGIRERVVLVNRHVSGNDADGRELINEDSLLAMAFIENHVAISSIEVSLTTNVRKAIQEAWKRHEIESA
jgi:hypothetical protein